MGKSQSTAVAAPPQARLTCSREELVEALAVVLAVTPSKGPRPILEDVLIAIEPDRVSLLATDLEVSVRLALVQADIEAYRMSICLNARRLAEFVRGLDGSRALLTFDGPTVRIASETGRSRFSLTSENDAAEFPDLSHLAGGATPDGAIPAALLGGVLRRVGLAIATEGTRYALNGLCVEVGPGALRFVATDGKRLAFEEVATAFKGSGQHIVARHGIAALARFAAGAAGDIGVALGERSATFTRGGDALSSQYVEGVFPPYGAVVPTGDRHRAEFFVADLLSAVRRAALAAEAEGKSGSKAVRLALEPGLCRVSASGQGRDGAAEVTCTYDGPPITIAFNATFLVEPLVALEGDDQPKVALDVKSPDAPGVLRCGAYTCVIMPISIG